MANTQHVGRIIRDRRIELGLTQVQVADMCDISTRELGNIELGDANPKWSTITSIAGALGLNLGDLNSCINTVVAV